MEENKIEFTIEEIIKYLRSSGIEFTYQKFENSGFLTIKDGIDSDVLKRLANYGFKFDGDKLFYNEDEW